MARNGHLHTSNTMKSLFALAVVIIGGLLFGFVSTNGDGFYSAPTAESPTLQTVTKIESNTVAGVIIISDTANKKSVSIPRGHLVTHASGTGTGSTASLYEAGSKQTITKGRPVSLIRCVGITNSDSLKIRFLSQGTVFKP